MTRPPFEVHDFTHIVPTVVSMARVHAACVLKVGWCVECKDFTTTHTEVDDYKVDCSKCKRPAVLGGLAAAEYGVILVR